jgi:membrane peptidoglycan carboxypeptidase
MQRITTALGETVRENPPTMVRRVIKEQTSQAVVEILRQVVRKGTGKSAAITGADVIGKTGTAQKADASGGYSDDKYVASFVGALMSTKPRVIIFVMIDEPAGKNRTGGKVAAPVFRTIGEGILALCGSKPSLPESILAAGSLGPRKYGQVHYRSVPVRKGANPDEWIVPDLKGMDMRQVLEACGKMKCDPTIQGTGRAVRQEPKPGKILKEGAPLTVAFEGQTS